MGRKQAREGAMRLLFQMESTNDFSDEALENYLDNFQYDDKETEYIIDAIKNIRSNIIEIDKRVSAKNRPVIIITSNAKKDLSDPFLGRCNFHHIAFPDPKMMRKIINVHFPTIDSDLAENAISTFFKLRELDGIEKRPATRELINWIRALDLNPDFRAKDLIKGKVPFLGILFK